VAASGSGPSAETYASDPVASTSAVPSRSGAVATSSTGTPSRLTPVSWPSIATISGSAAKRALTVSGLPVATTTASRSGWSTHRRTSPATTPPSASATASQSVRARSSMRPVRGRAGGAASAAAIRSSVCGPTPGTVCRRPSAVAARSSATVRTPRAAPTATSRPGARPCIRPNAASSGEIVCRSSSSSAMWPVSTSSRMRRSSPGPTPRSSFARPARTRSAMGSGVLRTSSAPRRKARTEWPLASESSSSVAYSASAEAMSSFDGVGTAPMWGLSPMSPRLASGCLVDRLLGDLGQLLVGRRLLVEGLVEELRRVGVPQLPGQGARGAVGRDLVVLDPLGRADQGGVACVAVAVGLRDLGALADQALHAVAVLALGLDADRLEHLFEPLHVSAGLLEMIVDGLRQSLRRGRLGDVRKRLHQLLLSAVEILQLCLEHIVERLQLHGVPPLLVLDEVAVYPLRRAG